MALVARKMLTAPSIIGQGCGLEALHIEGQRPIVYGEHSAWLLMRCMRALID